MSHDLDHFKVAAARRYFEGKFPTCPVRDAFIPAQNVHAFLIQVSPTDWYHVAFALAFLKHLSPTEIEQELEQRHIAETVAKQDVASITVNRADTVITCKED